MAKAYIANKPVRFDRNYSVGEVIPDSVISPKMGKKLVEMGRILRVDLPDTAPNSGGNGQEAAQDGAGQPTEDGDGEGEVNIHPEPQDAPEGAQGGTEGGSGATDTNVGTTEGDVPDIHDGDIADDGEDTDVPTSGEHVCPVCNRAFKSQNALAAHSKTHKE